jgi:hypothetical protein
MARLAGLEPATLGLEGRCSIRLSYKRLNGRGGGIRTPDILLPKQARYQAALHPDNLLITDWPVELSATLEELPIIAGHSVGVKCFLNQSSPSVSGISTAFRRSI